MWGLNRKHMPEGLEGSDEAISGQVWDIDIQIGRGFDAITVQ